MKWIYTRTHGPHINKTCGAAERVCRGVWFDVIDSDVSVFIYNTYVPTKPTYSTTYTYIYVITVIDTKSTLLFRSRLPFIVRARATPRNETRLPGTFVRSFKSLLSGRTYEARLSHARDNTSLHGRDDRWEAEAFIIFIMMVPGP